MRNRLEGRRRDIGMKTIILTISVIFPLLIGTPIQSQMAGSNPSASNPTPPLLIATEQEVRGFFDKYIERYNKKDIDGFLRLFSLKAVQNQQDGVSEMRELYSDVFNQSQELQNSVEDMKIEIFQNAVQVKARYTVNQVLKESGEKRTWKGNIRWVLVKEEGILKVISVDFRHSVSPSAVAARVPKPTLPQAPPLLAKEEEVKRFFSDYVGRYNQKDIDGFLSFFSAKAVQNQKDDLKGIRKIYTKFFDQSRELRYQTEGMKIEIYQNSVEVKARFRVDQRLKGGGEEKVWKGNIRWVLVKEDGNLKISSLDYQNEKTP
jgi:ketosteroid isomerase-like protein